MENTLLIEATEDTPKVELNSAAGIFELSGRSLPEDAVTFFKPVLEWFTEYFNRPNTETELLLKLFYYNSATARQLVDLLMLFEEAALEKNNIMIKWYYDKDDELMYERGLEMKEMTELPFEIILY